MNLPASNQTQLLTSCFAAGLFTGKKVMITGASRGIGRACALKFASLGADLFLISKDESRLSAMRDEIITSVQSSQQGLLGKINTFAVDVSDAEALQTIVRGIKDSGIEILINNAGIYITEPVQGHDLASWQRTIDTNLTAAMLTSAAFTGGMASRRWGRIVNISSISGRSGEAFGAAYSASKFGLIGLTQSLALEVAAQGITVNAVCPGWVATDMAYDQINDPRWCELNQIAVEQSMDAAKFSVPQERLLSPGEVADLVLFLSSDAAMGITGQAINICGGLSIHS
jgi:NAD(P)-dependent dehydrogenase (short-subunit alcohol dehydrogenase family)